MLPPPAYPLTRQMVHSLAVEQFPRENLTTVMAILDYYGIEPYERERERVQIAILKLSAGDVDKLLHYVDAAKQDYRDVLYWTEYADQVGQLPRFLPKKE
jgi:hypothetical protein